MSNIHGKVIDLIIAVLLMFIVPMIYLNKIGSVTKEIIIRQYTAAFIENICTHGYLSKQMYEEYVRELADQEYIVTVELEHEQQIMEPEYKIDSIAGGNPVFTGNVLTYQSIVYTDEIMEIMYTENKRYEMDAGDFIKVIVKINEGAAESEDIYDAYGSSDISNPTIVKGAVLTSFTGKIRDNQQIELGGGGG